jgi:hypothetical protein
MPGFGRGGMLPGPGRSPRGPRSVPPGADLSPRGPPGPGRSLRGPPGPGRSPPGRPVGCRGVAGGVLAPPPTPNGLLPTRGGRGPGLGVWLLGGTTAGVWPLWLDCAAAAGRAGCCGGRACSPAGDRGCAGGGAAGSDVRSGVLGRLAPGRGPGRLPGGWVAGRVVVGACAAAGATAGTAGAGVAGRGVGVGVDGTAGGAVGAAAGAAATLLVAGAGAGVGAAGAGRGTDSRAPPPDRVGLPLSDLGNESRNLRATGASTVEDADFTNSPKSLSLASTSLLVTPSSLASSCTRALPATGLLI